MKDLANFIIGVVCLPLNVFTIFIASYLLHADYSRRRPMLVASGERQKLLNPTMAIFLYYHAVASAIDFVCIPMYMAMNLELPGGNETYMFARLREFLCNLYIFLPPIVGGFVILDRLLVLMLTYRYDEFARRLIVYAELLCLTLMALAVCIYYQYLPQICTLIYGPGSLEAYLYCQNNWWKTRFVILIIVKAFIGGINTVNCLAFFYQVRKLQHIKMRTRIVQITVVYEVGLGVIPSFVAVWYYIWGYGFSGFQSMTFFVSLDAALSALTYFLLLRRKFKGRTAPSSVAR